MTAEPFIKNKNVVPRVMTLTQSTYDGIVYNVEMIKEKLGVGAGKVDLSVVPVEVAQDLDE